MFLRSKTDLEHGNMALDHIYSKTLHVSNCKAL